MCPETQSPLQHILGAGMTLDLAYTSSSSKECSFVYSVSWGQESRARGSKERGPEVEGWFQAAANPPKEAPVLLGLWSGPELPTLPLPPDSALSHIIFLGQGHRSKPRTL